MWLVLGTIVTWLCGHLVVHFAVDVTRHRQGRLHHINDGANAPWKSKGGEVFAAFSSNLGEDKIGLSLLNVSLG